jgi:uncharacterized UBP type Zn finger protein
MYDDDLDIPPIVIPKISGEDKELSKKLTTFMMANGLCRAQVSMALMSLDYIPLHDLI